MLTCRLWNTLSYMCYILVHECFAPNRDCIYGSCLRPMHRKLLQEATMAAAFVMRAGDDDKMIG